MIDIRKYAAGLLAQEGFLEVMRLLKAETIKDWANTEEKDVVGREARYADIQALGRFETKLKSLVDDATIDQRKADAAALKRGDIKGKNTW